MPTVQVCGIDLYYEMAGEGDALLLLHGLGSSSRDWEVQVAAFSTHYKVIAFDLRGHGRSGKPAGPYSIPLFATDTIDLMAALGITSAHVVGLSLGGMVAFQLAASRPDLVRSLVVVNAVPVFMIRTFRERVLLLQRLVIVRLMGMDGIARFLGRRLFPKPEQEALRRQMRARFTANDPRAYRAALRAMTTGWSVENHLAAFRCPTLVIAADGDYTSVEQKAAYVARIPGGELRVIEDSRHATPVDQPVEFNKAVLDFIGRHRTGKTS